MNIFDLPIEPNATIKDKTRAFIHESKIVCHPDLVDKVIEGMALMRASAKGFDDDITGMMPPEEVEGVEERLKIGVNDE